MKKILGAMACAVLAVVMVLSTGNIAYATEKGSVDTSIERGQEIYQNFLDTTAFIESDSTWTQVLQQYEKEGVMKVFFRNNHGELIDSTEIPYEELSPYKTFICIETYMQFAGVISTKVGVAKYIENTTNNVGRYMNIYAALWDDGNNSDEVKAAFRDLVEWQFAYIRENGYPYNFITGKSYAEEMGLSTEEVKESPKESTNEAGLTDEEVEDILSELSDEEIEELKEAFAEESGKDSKKETGADAGAQATGVAVAPLIIVVLLVAVVAAVVIVVMNNKKKNEKK